MASSGILTSVWRSITKASSGPSPPVSPTASRICMVVSAVKGTPLWKARNALWTSGLASAASSSAQVHRMLISRLSPVLDAKGLV